MDPIQARHAEMEFLNVPGTSIRASRIALGTWAIGGWMWGGSNQSDAIRAIHSALEGGFNLIDTAPVYGFGRSEEIGGKALALGSRRSAIFMLPIEYSSHGELDHSSALTFAREPDQSLARGEVLLEAGTMRPHIG
jgi:diketogulonate reductase-like aldo/keto reductase